MLARMYRKGNHHTLLVGMKIGATTMGNIMKTSQKLQIKLPYDIAIPLLGIHLKKTNLLIQKDTCTPNFHSSERNGRPAAPRRRGTGLCTEKLFGFQQR